MSRGHETGRVTRRAGRARRIGLGATTVVMALATTCGAPPPISDSTYELVFVEQFDGDAIRPHWATAPFGGSLPATVQDGILTLRSTAANHHRWGYVASTGPRLDPEPNYPFASAWQEGYFEARLRFTDDPWAWPAFWLFSMAKTEAWPGEDCTKLNAEWDIMENGVGTGRASAWHVSVLHRNTTDNTADGYCGITDETRVTTDHFPDTDLSGWHTWAGRWSADELCTYLDGVEIDCVEPFASTAQPMHIVFTINYLGECPGCPPRPDGLEMQVDWVRVWQPT